MTSKAGMTDLAADTLAPTGRLDDPERRRLRWLLFWFYGGVPLALGFFLGWLQVGRAADWPRAVSLLYWMGTFFAMTPLLALGTAALSPLLRRLRSPLWVTLLCGQLVGGLFVDPLLRGYRSWIQANVHPELVLTPATTLAEFLQRLPSNSLLWIGINLAFFYGLRMPRFGYRPAPPAIVPARLPPAISAAPASAPTAPTAVPAPPAEAPRDLRPALMERVRPERRGALLALEAEGHYLRVYTDAGSDLVLYRLSDAINEYADGDGAQVHRSWWVAERALSSERHRDRLKLVNGVEVPVSRSFRIAARQRGWLSAAEPRDG